MSTPLLSPQSFSVFLSKRSHGGVNCKRGCNMLKKMGRYLRKKKGKLNDTFMVRFPVSGFKRGVMTRLDIKSLASSTWPPSSEKSKASFGGLSQAITSVIKECNFGSKMSYPITLFGLGYDLIEGTLSLFSRFRWWSILLIEFCRNSEEEEALIFPSWEMRRPWKTIQWQWNLIKCG